ncbi:MAG: class I SAM-dependent methyltransferase [Anaerolineales bacterium]|nr:class I SAM-dependent methyltransferase [Anaerolineales bacterium]
MYKLRRLVWKIFYIFRFPIEFMISRARLKSLEVKLRRKEGDTFRLPFEYEGVGFLKTIRPKQNLQEIRALYDLVKASNVRFAAEIGTYRGGTFYLWCQAARPDAKLIAIDLPGDHSWEAMFSWPRLALYRQFAQSNRQQLHFIPGNSHDRHIVENFRQVLGNDQLDFLFIDGDHSYDGVKQDCEAYKTYVRPGGMIVFHDILPRGIANIQVDRFWEEIKQTYRHQEFIGESQAVGIGVLWV